MADTPPKILHVLSSLSPVEGGSVAAARMAIAQRQAGLETEVIAPDASATSTSLSDELAANQIQLTRLAWSARKRLPPRDPQRKSLREAVGRADFVHVHGLFEAVSRAALDDAVTNNAATILSPHGMLTRWSLSRKAFKKWGFRKLVLDRRLRRLTAIHFATSAEAKASEPAFPRQAESLMIPLPLDFDQIDASLPSEGRPREYGRIVSLGRIAPGKGVMCLVEAWARVCRSPAGQSEAGQSWELEIIGDSNGAYALTCRQRAESLGIADRIHWAGRIEPPSLFTRLRRAGWFAQPSEHENFGQAALEAMACGCAALLSPGVAISTDAIQAGGAASIPRDAQALAEALIEHLQAPQTAETMGHRGAAWARSYCGMNAVGSAWRQALSEFSAAKASH